MPPRQCMKHYQPKTIIDRDREWHDQLRLIADLLQQGLDMGEVAQRAGLSEGWVRQLACAYGLIGPARPVERPLSQRQTRILAFIKDFIAKHSYSPTVREITDACRISSTSVADYNLRRLECMSYLTRRAGSARSIVLTDRGSSWLPPVSDSSIREAA